MPDNIFLSTTTLLAIAVTVSFVIRLLRQPLLVAYIAAGIIAGPLFLNLIDRRAATYEAFAEFGVVLLLFLVGLSLNFAHLRSIGRTAVIAGVGQILFTAVVGYLILLPFDLSTASRLYLAVAITFSSTIIIVKLLTDKGDTETVYGRHAIGLMLVQDLIAIALLVILSSTASGTDTGSALTALFLRGAVITVAAILCTRTVLPRLLPRIARSSELLFLFTVTWCFGIASLVRWAGFSLEVGAVIAGVSLGSSTYQPEIGSRIRPLRDFFLVLFFIILGSQMQVAALRASLPVGVALALFITIGNPLILYLIFRRMHFTRRNSFLAGVTAAQVSEFGFVLLFTGQRLGHVSSDLLPMFTITALVTIVASSYLITYSEQLYRFLRPVFSWFGPDRYQQLERAEEPCDVWVFGYHRIGWKVCEALRAKGSRFAVVDFNPQTIAALKEQGLPACFGDVTDMEFLEALPLHRAKLIISTIPSVDDQRVLLARLREIKAKARVVVTANDTADIDGLYAAGAHFVIMPHLLGGVWIADILQHKPWTDATFAALRKEQRVEMQLHTAATAHS